MNRGERTGKGFELHKSGPLGKGFSLLGEAKTLGKKAGLREEEILAILVDMMSGDYLHLEKVFNDHFGNVKEKKK